MMNNDQTNINNNNNNININIKKKKKTLIGNHHHRCSFPVRLIFAATTILIISKPATIAAGATTFVYAGCSTSKFEPNTAYQSNLNSLLSTIAAASSRGSPFSSFASGNSSGSAAAFGLYQCRPDLSATACSDCARSASVQLGLICPLSIAASLQLDGCFVGYSGRDDFIGGALDTSLSFKRCGPTADAGGADDFFRRRDDVLGELELNGAGVGFRASRSGTVQGCAQCLGDLASGDCRSCVAQAVGDLRSACGSAMAADVYLAKCYARFWAEGYYLGSSSSSSEDDDSGDEIGKTVAIIIGIVAGLALLVVFASYLRRAC